MLNLHGEVPSNAGEGVTVMNAESRFLPVLKNLVDKYPRLKIVLEHCTTADAVETVRSFGANVVGTIVRGNIPCFLPFFVSLVVYLGKATCLLMINALL